MNKHSTFRTLEISDAALSPTCLRFLTVKSAALRHRADVTLVLPEPGALGPRGHLPIVMLLHGAYGSHWAWAFKGGAWATGIRMMREGTLPPMVLAMPSDGLHGDGSGYVPHTSENSEAWIVDEVPKAVAEVVPECSAQAPCGIVGLSMGGFAALRLAAKYPARFVAAVGHSSITSADQLDPLIEESRSEWSVNPVDQSIVAAAQHSRSPLPALRFDCGLEDPYLRENRALHNALVAAGIPHDYAEYGGGHDWTYWALHLPDSLRFVARAFAASQCR